METKTNASEIEYKTYFKNFLLVKIQYCKATAKIKKRRNKIECSNAILISKAKKLAHIK